MKRSRNVTRFFHRLRPRDAGARGRRQLYRERIDALRHTASSKDAFYDYLFLFLELKDTDLIAELRGAFRQEWVPHMRRELARHLRVGDWARARRRIKEMRWEWQEGVDEHAPAAVAALIAHLEHPANPPAHQVIWEIVDGFETVGLEAAGPVVEWLAASAPGDECIVELLFSRAGASGRYLARRWGEQDRAVLAWLHKHEHLVMPSLPVAGGPCAFWPGERPEPPAAQQSIARLALDFNPFGPDRAEQDPLLPDLFYRLWPVWQELTAPQPTIFVAPPGCGRSALVSMARYESGLAGSALDRTLAAHAPLHLPLEPSSLAQHLARAVYVAVTCLLARCPDALLALDDAGQKGLGAFLLQVSGGLPPLLADLERAGQRSHDPHARLLCEALDRAANQKRPSPNGVDATGSEYSLAVVRALLHDAFTDRELLVFCQDRPAFRPALAEFGPRFSFADMVNALVSYALRREELGALLSEVEAFNPRQFARYRPRLAQVSVVPISPAITDPLTLARPHGVDYVLLLVDVCFRDEAGVAALLDCLFERWLPSLSRQHIVPKVFIPAPPPACPVAPVPIEWAADGLYELLQHRLERAGLVRDQGQPLLEAWVDGVDDPGRVLVEAAHGTPKHLIRLGNRLLTRLGETVPLGKEAFLELLDSQ